jgi:hypothetical protein
MLKAFLKFLHEVNSVSTEHGKNEFCDNSYPLAERKRSLRILIETFHVPRCFAFIGAPNPNCLSGRRWLQEVQLLKK